MEEERAVTEDLRALISPPLLPQVDKYPEAPLKYCRNPLTANQQIGMDTHDEGNMRHRTYWWTDAADFSGFLDPINRNGPTEASALPAVTQGFIQQPVCTAYRTWIAHAAQNVGTRR